MKDRALVRAVNERTRLVARPFVEIADGEGSTDFMCECVNERCFAVVPLTMSEWAAATAQPDYFVVRPDHVARGEQAVVATDRYAVVRPARAGEPAHR